MMGQGDGQHPGGQASRSSEPAPENDFRCTCHTCGTLSGDSPSPGGAPAVLGACCSVHVLGLGAHTLVGGGGVVLWTLHPQNHDGCGP